MSWRSSAVPCFAWIASADVPRTTKVKQPIHPADFDHIAASLRQCAIFRGRCAITIHVVPAQHCSEIMSAQQGTAMRPEALSLHGQITFSSRNRPMKKFALIAAATLALIASPAMSQSMSQQVKQSEGVMKTQQQTRGAPRGRSFRLSFARMGRWGHHRHHRHHYR
jgi:hypothetical protein